MNLVASNVERQPTIPLGGMRALASIWGGAATLYEWLVPSEWEISRQWSPDLVKARVAEAILVAAETNVMPLLPRSHAGWLDQFDLQLHRVKNYTAEPTAHTDWALTLSQFGRYPSLLYVERRPHSSFDSAFVRVALWTARAVKAAEQLVAKQFQRSPLTPVGRTRLLAPLGLPELQTVVPRDTLDSDDLAACSSQSGLGAVIANLARQLSALSKKDPLEQIAALPPMLPQLGSQLFELACLGECALALRAASPDAAWRSKVPMGASELKQPCLEAECSSWALETYYQVVPKAYDPIHGPYFSLARELGGQPLRPDVWMRFSGSRMTTSEIIIECKWSLDRSYVTSGIPQVVSYQSEYPCVGKRRLYVVVGPEETVDKPRSWNGSICLVRPEDLGLLVTSTAVASEDALLEAWKVGIG